MLPVTLQFIIAMLSHALNERMAHRVEYLQEEVRVLQEAPATATGKTRIAFTPKQRLRLALKGKALTPREREIAGPSEADATAFEGRGLRDAHVIIGNDQLTQALEVAIGPPRLAREQRCGLVRAKLDGVVAFLEATGAGDRA